MWNFISADQRECGAYLKLVTSGAFFNAKNNNNNKKIKSR